MILVDNNNNKSIGKLSYIVFQLIKLLLEVIISSSTNSLGTIATPKNNKGTNTDIFAELLADSAAAAWATKLSGLNFFSILKARLLLIPLPI